MPKTVAEALQSLTNAVNELNVAFTKANQEMPSPQDGLVIPPAVPAKPGKKKYSEIDGTTTQGEREKRQKLILAAIEKAGGTVTREDWLKITSKFGYNSRRLGGFFGRSTNGVSAGMVEMSTDRTEVRITDYGRSRLKG